ncbi:beta-glucosidase [Enterococcus sp. JM4C]|uniref:glycoside hydrolase family 3 N-terminal domain-containing protein n=1 Tax=Candidatus Enterococcus huntleyi TaxID=1857217 RepID=UPI0013799964|nr:glycoside hydrolase family 3 N-terminal domain-containing protein [Enterococcus sp. JM4C]KAF1299094.1 beta-glucosidase [Enterococcus sp. JM4C]
MEIEKLKQRLLSLSLEEKVGQLVQVTPDFFGNKGEITGPLGQKIADSTRYQIGSVLGTHRAAEVKQIQADYLAHSKHQIPLLFMADVIHGYETIFPIPLALASSFDEELIERVAQNSAVEAASEGIHVTFSPMADYVKDPRWGRVLESNGEDPRLSTALTKAYVRGYQGDDLKKETSLAACVKHFIGYGAAEGGRDYNTVDISDVELHQNYLPAFEGAISAGVQLVMTSFNSVHGVPVTANKALIQSVLRGKLRFDGVLISDWAAIAELKNHRVAQTSRDAAKKAFDASVDIDMMTDCYSEELAAIVEENHLMPQLDAAVWRILLLKNELGLFENPYRGLENKVDKDQLKVEAFEVATRSAVLLKNEAILPLKKEDKLLVVGTKAATTDVLGAWSWIGDSDTAISLAAGLEKECSAIEIIAIDDEKTDWSKIKLAAHAAEKVVIAVGEDSQEAGEAASRAKLNLSAIEQELIDVISHENSESILVTFSGRPLVLTDVEEKVKAIVVAWFLGNQTGTALAALLTGQKNFSGHLPMSFPRSVGQLPYSYQEMSTGRPMTEENADQKYISRYLDEENSPLYAFGHGLSYSAFTYSELRVSTDELRSGCELELSFEVTNESELAGYALPQIYFTDEYTEVIRPKRELLAWQQVQLDCGETKTIHFTIRPEDLAYVHSDLSRTTDPGEFRFYLAKSALDIVSAVSVTYVE